MKRTASGLDRGRVNDDVEGAKALEQVKHHILRLEEDYSIRDVAPRVA
jgi:hypothetical protein